VSNTLQAKPRVESHQLVSLPLCGDVGFNAAPQLLVEPSVLALSNRSCCVSILDLVLVSSGLTFSLDKGSHVAALFLGKHPEKLKNELVFIFLSGQRDLLPLHR